MPHSCDERSGWGVAVVATPVAVVLAVTALCAAGLVPAALVPAGLVPVGGRARSAVRVADVIWDELADCESGGDWRADTGNGYYGGLQIRAPTWTEAGGLRFADRPDHATRREQTTVGEEILRRQGWEAWPDCARELGLVG